MDLHSTIALRSGRTMPVLGLGTWQLTQDTAGTVAEALRLGYRMIDTAVDYGSQPGVGDAIRDSDLDRRDIFVVTKVEENEDAYAGTRRNLDELGLDYTNLTLVHRPPPDGLGESLWRGLMRAREDGLTRDIGVSNYSIDQMERLVELTGEVPVVNQIEWTPFGWSRDMLDYCRQRGIVVHAYSPLTRTERLDDPPLVSVADAVGRTQAQVLLRWNLQHRVVPLPKANRLEHLKQNLEVFDFELDDSQVAHLDRCNEHWSALGPSLPYR